MRRIPTLLLIAIFLCVPVGHAQSEVDPNPGPVAGGHELQAWLSQTHVLSSMSSGREAELTQIGGRFGWVLTRPKGPGPLRGEFEYTVNFLPVILPIQSNGATYGFGLDPISLKWNFQRRGNLVPYAELDGGGMETVGRVPPAGTHWNFTASGGVGLQVLRGGRVLSFDFRFYHISDASILTYRAADGDILHLDPTYNTLQLRVGFGIFRRPKNAKF